MSQIPPQAARLVKASLLFFPIFTVLFWLASPLGLLGAAYLSLLLELLPALAIAQLPLAEDEGPLPRLPVYFSSSMIILVLGALGLGVGWLEFGWEPMGLGPTDLTVVASWTGILCVAALLLLLGFLLFRKWVGIRETPLLAQLLPESWSEKGVFILLSLSAGFGEELAYRGFLIPALTELLGQAWGAALLSSAVFGLLHAYQGWLGILRTGLLGLVLAASLLLSGTLWPAILAHAILDVMAGVVFGDILVRE